MLLRVKHSGRYYFVEAPAGSRLQRDGRGHDVLVVTGESPGDTATCVPTARLLKAASTGLFGLALRQRTDGRPIVMRA